MEREFHVARGSKGKTSRETGWGVDGKVKERREMRLSVIGLGEVGNSEGNPMEAS